MIAFELSMPGVASWNGRWTGEGRSYVIVRSLGRSRAAIERELELTNDSPYRHDFGDGWAASVSVRSVEPQEARKLRSHSSGFCGYDWMVEEIIDHGRILTLDERTAVVA